MFLGISIDLRTGRVEIRIGQRHKVVLLEIDNSLEDISIVMEDGFILANVEGKYLDMDHFFKIKKIKD